MTLVDTDVWIDCLRSIPAAMAWMQKNRSEQCTIPSIVAMELVAGCQNQAELVKTQKFLSAFEILWPEPTESVLALDLLAKYKLSFGIGIPDCMIAAMALTRRLPLYSFNVKHFQPIAGLVLKQPYSRG